MNFTEKEIQTIADALLFASSTNMCADWVPEDDEEMMNLAFKILDETKTKPSKKVTYFDGPPEFEFEEKIREKYPEIVKGLLDDPCPSCGKTWEEHKDNPCQPQDRPISLNAKKAALKSIEQDKATGKDWAVKISDEEIKNLRCDIEQMENKKYCTCN